MDKTSIIILSPNTPQLLSHEHYKKLRLHGNVTSVTTPQKLSDIPELWKRHTKKIVMLDPDFCEWDAPKDLIAIPNLSAVCLQTTSFSWIDASLFQKAGIPVTNLRHWSTESVAEWALFMALAIARRVPTTLHAKNDTLPFGTELSGKTAAIIGMGHIGTRIAELASAFGMKVIYWSKHTRDPRFTISSLDSLFREGDIIFPALAANKETKLLITDALLTSMKRDALFVSITHAIYNHSLVYSLAKKNAIGGYAFETDNQKEIKKIQGNIWAGPALGWKTEEARKRNALQWVQCATDAASGKFPNGVLAL